MNVSNEIVVVEKQTGRIEGIPYVPFPIAFHTVDIIALSETIGGETQVLLGKKPNQTKWQFIGGFVEPTHTAEHTASKEFHEEAGLLIEDEDRFEYVGSAYIEDSRYKDSCHKITTSIFMVRLSENEEDKLVAGDDIEIIKWFSLKDAYANIREQHKEIFVKALIKLLQS